MNNTTNPFKDFNYPDPEADIFYEDFFFYKHTKEFKEAKKQGGLQKYLAFLRAFLF